MQVMVTVGGASRWGESDEVRVESMILYNMLAQ